MINTSGAKNNDPDTAGYESVAAGAGTSFLFATNEYGSNEYLTITCDNAELAGLIGISTNEAKSSVIGKDAVAEFTTGADGNRIGFANSAILSTYGNRITVRDNNDKTFIMDIPGKMVANNGTVDIVQEVTDIGSLKVHVGANENQYIDVRLPEVSASTLGTDAINVYTHGNASKAITKVDEAISRLSTIRSKIGAYDNRLEHTTSNLDVSNENLTSAISRIMDVDMAEEMTEYTSLNVLAQAGTSMLSQANARPETVLQLLQK
jgi:flagellin